MDSLELGFVFRFEHGGFDPYNNCSISSFYKLGEPSPPEDPIYDRLRLFMAVDPPDTLL